MIVQLESVRKDYGDTAVLDDVSLEVREGEVVVIIGASGSGKSTILRLISNLETASGGKIQVCGISLSGSRSSRAVHESVGMVFQQFNLFPHLSALGNVTLALRRVKKLSKSDADAVARQSLTNVGLQEKADSMPAELSGGQQQRVAIARALALQPKLMLFDEATSALDPELVGEVTSVMRKLAEDGMTMVIVTHEMHFAREVADRVVFIDRGRVVEEGPARQVLSEPRNARTRQFLERVINV